MPRYYFHLEDHPSDPDPEGAELADLDAARYEAMRYVSELLRTLKADHLVRNGPVLVRVTDENNDEVALLEIRDKLASNGKGT